MYSHLSRREASVTKFLKARLTNQQPRSAPLHHLQAGSPQAGSPQFSESEALSRPAAGTLTEQLKAVQTHSIATKSET